MGGDPELLSGDGGSGDRSFHRHAGLKGSVEIFIDGTMSFFTAAKLLQTRALPIKQALQLKITVKEFIGGIKEGVCNAIVRCAVQIPQSLAFQSLTVR